MHAVSEKPVYACELCPAKCGRKTDLRIHVQKLHTSDKPLKCKRCGKSFPDRYSCKIHNKVGIFPLSVIKIMCVTSQCGPRNLNP